MTTTEFQINDQFENEEGTKMVIIDIDEKFYTLRVGNDLPFVQPIATFERFVRIGAIDKL